MEQLIELSPFILGGIGVLSLVVATLARIISKEKRQSKLHKTFTFIGFFCLIAAAGITAWTIMASLRH
jgi:ABC-type enterochelin transport system permease subunit